MSVLPQVAREVQEFVAEQGWRCCLIGGLAVPRWGRPRATQDVDISLLTGFGAEEEVVDCLLGRFQGRIADAREFALSKRVLLLKSTNDTGIDISLAAFPFEERVIARSSPFELVSGIILNTASAEDLILLKAVAGRPIDWFDIEGIITRQSKALDWHC